MPSEELTQLPVGIPTLSDVVYAVQGYSSPSLPGTSVQESLQSILGLMQSSFVLAGSGNPNGVFAGTTYQLYYDRLNGILYVCTMSGTATTAVWSKSITLTAGSGVTILQSGNIIEISAAAVQGLIFNNITSASAAMVTNNAYQANNSSLVTLTLPTTSTFGDALWVSGYGAGGWAIVQGTGQQIIIGDESTTVGVGGSLSSTNQYDGIELYCVVPNLIWKNISGPQGVLTYI
jgi:hypothetical protein